MTSIARTSIKRIDLTSGTNRGQRGLGGRSLQRQQRPIVAPLDRAGGRQRLTQVGFVGVLAGRHWRPPKRLSPSRAIIRSSRTPAVLIGEQGVSLPTRSQAHDVHGHDQLQRTRGILAAAGARPDFELSHMRHVEKPGRRADVKVLFQNSARVLNRHLVSGERHHAGAEIEMEPIERRALEWRGRNDVAHDSTRATRTNTRARSAKGANVATVKGLGSMKTEDMRGTFDPTRRSIYVVPPL